MGYENWIRFWETKAGSVVGVNGGIDAIRRDLFRPMRHDYLPDFILPLRVVEKGFRVVYEPAAVLEEETLENSQDEMSMRVRVTARSFRTLWTMRTLFNPIRYGLFSFQLMLHKLLRYLVGIFQILIFFSSWWLAAESSVFSKIYIAQIIFYAVAMAGLFLRNRPQKIPFITQVSYLCLLNAAALVALGKVLRGKDYVVWQPRKGSG
jgi:cellulose synthase/poly-beta-1,6-N-acetylglucosamine synthase-like glycosyltransferase